MRAGMRWLVVIVAAVGLGIPLIMVWSWVSVLSAFAPPERGPEAPASPAPAASAPANPAVAPVAAAVPPAPPPRLDFRPLPTRAAPVPVTPGEARAASLPKVRPLPPAPPPAEWESVEIVNPFGVGSPSPAITKTIKAELRAQLAECFQRDAQAGWGGLGKAYSTLTPNEPPSVGPAILVLEVEASASGVKIVDAPVERRGAVSDGTLNCAQAVLRGAAVAAPSEGRERFRMRFQLRQ